MNKIQRKDREKKANKLIDDINTRINEYVIWFSNNDNIKININQNVSRPDNVDDYTLISEYIQNNYGSVVYEIIELKDLKKVSI